MIKFVFKKAAEIKGEYNPPIQDLLLTGYRDTAILTEINHYNRKVRPSINPCIFYIVKRNSFFDLSRHMTKRGEVFEKLNIMKQCETDFLYTGEKYEDYYRNVSYDISILSKSPKWKRKHIGNNAHENSAYDTHYVKEPLFDISELIEDSPITQSTVAEFSLDLLFTNNNHNLVNYIPDNEKIEEYELEFDPDNYTPPLRKVGALVRNEGIRTLDLPIGMGIPAHEYPKVLDTSYDTCVGYEEDLERLSKLIERCPKEKTFPLDSVSKLKMLYMQHNPGGYYGSPATLMYDPSAHYTLTSLTKAAAKKHAGSGVVVGKIAGCSIEPNTKLANIITPILDDRKVTDLLVNIASNKPSEIDTDRLEIYKITADVINNNK